ncbi:MAG: hypothetical protein IJ740_00075 [Ruminococcus sp.]|nr:hypothetical protein [Ruminococcus sp.]
MKNRLMGILLSTAVLGSALILPPATAFAESEARVININSGAERSADFVTVNEEINTSSGSRKLIMTGLKDANKDLAVKAVEDNYDEKNSAPIKLIDNSFCDAEKWSVTNGEYTENADSKQCWASATSNMLWISGWASRVNNPTTGKPFESEDEIFELYNEKFTDEGSEAPEAITWFFTGEYYSPTFSRNAALIDTENPVNGVMKQFYCPLVLETYKLTSDSGAISNLERLNCSADSSAVMHVGVSRIYDGSVARTSQHALTAAGVITDPNAEKAEDKYKAILLIDSDNDGEPIGEAAELDNPTVEQRNADKKARPNSYTLYPLKFKKDIQGIPYWEVVNFSEDDEWYIHRLDVFPLYSEDVIEGCTETEGTKSVVDNVDLVLETAFATNKTITIDRLFQSENTVKKDTFTADEAINLSYFISNRSSVIFDEDYFNGRSVRVDWEVVNKATGKVVLQGSDYAEFPIWSLVERNYVTPLNSKNGKHIDLDAGEYTVTVKANSDKSIPEAYFLNNVSKQFDFTVTPAKPKLNKTSLSLSAGAVSTLKVTNGTVKTWKSSDSNVAKVAGGKVIALKKGSAVITAALKTGEKLSCKLTVKTNPTIKINGKALSQAKPTP